MSEPRAMRVLPETSRRAREIAYEPFNREPDGAPFGPVPYDTSAAEQQRRRAAGLAKLRRFLPTAGQ